MKEAIQHAGQALSQTTDNMKDKLDVDIRTAVDELVNPLAAALSSAGSKKVQAQQVAEESLRSGCAELVRWCGHLRS
jgi:hypothetical protein